MKARWLVLVAAFFIPSVWASNSHHRTLPNGLQVFVIEDHRAPVVYSSVWYRVGGADEVNGRTGLSHMLEHMLFRGTKTTRDGEYAQTIHNLGGEMNAMTTPDFTMYHSAIPVKGVSLVLKLEADRMRNLVITNKLLQREKEVVKEERQMRVNDNPSNMLAERFYATAFVNNPYHHPVVGWPKDVASYTLADVKGWYNKWYHPNNATLILVGDLSAKQGFSLAKKYFANIPRVVLPVRKHRSEVPTLGKKRLLVHYPAKVPVLKIGYLVPGLAQLKGEKWKAYALEVLAGVLDATPSSRLNQHLVRDRPVAASISTYYFPMHRYKTQFQINAIPARGRKLVDVEAGISQEIANLQESEVSADELDRVKAQVVASYVYQKDSLEYQAMNVGIPLMTQLPWNIDQQWVKYIEAVTAHQVQWVAQRYLSKKRLTVGYLEPTAVK